MARVHEIPIEQEKSTLVRKKVISFSATNQEIGRNSVNSHLQVWGQEAEGLLLVFCASHHYVYNSCDNYGGEKNIPQLNPGQLSEISDDNNWILEGLTTSPFLQLFFTFLSGKGAKRGCES